MSAFAATNRPCWNGPGRSCRSAGSRSNPPRVDRQYSLQVAPQPETQAPVYSLEQGLETLAHSPQLGYVLAMLEYDLELHVAEHTPNFVFVHAGVVGWQGRAIVIPGRSYSGKSSLVAGLCHAGASYYSDEYALFDADGRVHAYRRPLRLRQQVPNVPVRRPEDVQQAGTPDPLPVGLVVLTHFAPGAGSPGPCPRARRFSKS